MRIQTAKTYIDELNFFAKTGEFKHVDLFGADEKTWTKHVADSSERLTVCSEHLIQTKDLEPYDVKSSYQELVKSSELQKIISKGIMEIDFTATERIVDRDGDIVEPMGMKINGQIPLLFNHNMLNPIGAVIKILEQSQERIRLKGVVGDTALGRDMANLIELGAMRISQGFTATLAEEIFKTINGMRQQTGWLIKSGEMLEASVTPIPSNRACMISHHERIGFETPLMKSYAAHLKSQEPRFIKGHDFGPSASEARQLSVSDSLSLLGNKMLSGCEESLKGVEKLNQIKSAIDSQKQEEEIVSFLNGN